MQLALANRASPAHMWKMAYRVTRASLEDALRHLVRYGDTDIFPHLSELAFFVDEEAAIVDKLEQREGSAEALRYLDHRKLGSTRVFIIVNIPCRSF
jgi:hypothetical protein